MKKDTKQRIQELEREFAKKGYRLTLPRRAILESLSSTTKHLSVEDIYFTVHKKNPQIGMATIYRTLDLLISWGVVHKFDFGDSKARYELINDPKGLGHHHHLICTNCKKIIDYNDFIDDEIMFLNKTEAALSKRHNFIINNHIIEFYGLCEKCQK